ncbi:hypothetical protein ENTCAN_07401 [Enterobacter cancerogenus ATCC 35316]|nr:hypothetical protein ENTCAN_07401 [Enterobacter cancerogenus ATCC 35316]
MALRLPGLGSKMVRADALTPTLSHGRGREELKKSRSTDRDFFMRKTLSYGRIDG